MQREVLDSDTDLEQPVDGCRQRDRALALATVIRVGRWKAPKRSGSIHMVAVSMQDTFISLSVSILCRATIRQHPLLRR